MMSISPSPISPISPPDFRPEQQREFHTGEPGHIAYKHQRSPFVNEDLDLSPVPKENDSYRAEISHDKLQTVRMSERSPPKTQTNKKSRLPVTTPKSETRSEPKKRARAKTRKTKEINSLGSLKFLTLEEFFETKSLSSKQHMAKHLNRGSSPEFNQEINSESVICSSIKNGEIQFLLPRIGKGSYGEVFEINFPGKGPGKRYVVKTAYSRTIPVCVEAEQNYKRMDGLGITEIPAGSFICDEAVSEFLISLLIGDLSNKSLNFINTYYFGTCREKQYTFMDKIDTTLYNLANVESYIQQRHLESIYIQIVHAVALYQDTYRIVHGDLKMDNIFIENVSSNYRSKELENTNYFSYKIKEKQIYIPSCPWIVKIGDWGLSVKYFPRFIGSKKTLTGLFDEETPVIPNFYSKAYDVAYITILMYLRFPHCELIKECLAWILQCQPKDVNRKEISKCYNIESAYYFRPKVEELERGTLSHVTPLSILSEPLSMRKFYEKPRDSKVPIIGVL